MVIHDISFYEVDLDHFGVSVSSSFNSTKFSMDSASMKLSMVREKDGLIVVWGHACYEERNPSLFQQLDDKDEFNHLN